MTDKMFADMRRDAERLKTYADIDGTEVGEVSQLLYQLSFYTAYVSESFIDAVAAEIRERLDNFEENSTIIETEQTATHTVRYLEWS